MPFFSQKLFFSWNAFIFYFTVVWRGKHFWIFSRSNVETYLLNTRWKIHFLAGSFFYYKLFVKKNGVPIHRKPPYLLQNVTINDKMFVGDISTYRHLCWDLSLVLKWCLSTILGRKLISNSSGQTQSVLEKVDGKYSFL